MNGGAKILNGGRGSSAGTGRHWEQAIIQQRRDGLELNQQQKNNRWKEQALTQQRKGAEGILKLTPRTRSGSAEGPNNDEQQGVVLHQENDAVRTSSDKNVSEMEKAAKQDGIN